MSPIDISQSTSVIAARIRRRRELDQAAALQEQTKPPDRVVRPLELARNAHARARGVLHQRLEAHLQVLAREIELVLEIAPSIARDTKRHVDVVAAFHEP